MHGYVPEQKKFVWRKALCDCHRCFCPKRTSTDVKSPIKALWDPSLTRSLNPLQLQRRTRLEFMQGLRKMTAHIRHADIPDADIPGSAQRQFQVGSRGRTCDATTDAHRLLGIHAPARTTSGPNVHKELMHARFISCTIHKART